MGKQSYNWAAAFVAFVNNHPLQEIAESFGIPLERLQARASDERWSALRTELPLAPVSHWRPSRVSQSRGWGHLIPLRVERA